MGNYKQISLAIDSTLNVNGSGQLQVASSIAGAAGVEATRAEAAEATIAGNLTSHAELTTTAHGGIVANTDSRLTDARTPTAHAATHEAGGSDPLPIGTANGIASLDNSGKVPLTQLPSGVWIYEGVWNAATNTPMLVNGTGAVGELYVVSTAGTHDFGAGAQTFSGGDLCIYNGSVWERSASGNNVVTVNGYAGAVVLAAADVGADASGSAAAAQSAAESFATSAIAAAAPPAWTVLDSTTPIAVQSTLDPAAYDTLADYLAALGPLGSNGFFQLTVCTGDLGDQSFENAITGYNGSDNNPLVGDVYQWDGVNLNVVSLEAPLPFTAIQYALALAVDQGEAMTGFIRYRVLPDAVEMAFALDVSYIGNGPDAINFCIPALAGIVPDYAGGVLVQTDNGYSTIVPIIANSGEGAGGFTIGAQSGFVGMISGTVEIPLFTA